MEDKTDHFVEPAEADGAIESWEKWGHAVIQLNIRVWVEHPREVERWAGERWQVRQFRTPKLSGES